MHATQFLSATHPDAGTRGLFVQSPVSAGVPRAGLIRWVFCDNLASGGLLPADCISPALTCISIWILKSEVCQNISRERSRDVSDIRRACIACWIKKVDNIVASSPCYVVLSHDYLSVIYKLCITEIMDM